MSYKSIVFYCLFLFTSTAFFAQTKSMNKYYVIILIVGLSFFMSCHKENITTTGIKYAIGFMNPPEHLILK